MIHLIYAATPIYGGWVTFTAHLQLCLQAVGLKAGIAKIGKRFEQHTRQFLGELGYQNLPVEAVSGATPVITALDKAHLDSVRPVINRSWVVLHDPTEVNAASRELFQSARGLVVIREKNLELARGLNPQTIFIPHPFEAPQPPGQPEPRPMRAVSVSRLDWDKHIDLIVQANAELPPGKRVQIFGAENRLYTHHKLAAIAPSWRDNYHGAFSRSDVLGGYRLAQQAEWVVDLSAIKGDGAGTQYTFLEAIAADAALVLNEKWFADGTASVLVPSENCLTVADAEHLARTVRHSPPPFLAQNARRLLATHAYGRVGEQWLALLS